MPGGKNFAEFAREQMTKTPSAPVQMAAPTAGIAPATLAATPTNTVQAPNQTGSNVAQLSQSLGRLPPRITAQNQASRIVRL